MNNTFIIADSGSTKTEWCVVENGIRVNTIYTKGMNPFFQTAEEIEEEIRLNLLPHISHDNIEAIYFYGAGCIPAKIPMVTTCLQNCFLHAHTIEVSSDLLAAARALCLHQSGIACILGTGSNSCFYNGTEISFNVPALGFILGDEGSGANLGKLLVGDILKNQLTTELKEKFFSQFNTNMADIIEKVYRQPFPNRYLASLSVFLVENRNVEQVHRLLVHAFKAFIQRNVMQYDYENHPMNCVGSIAYYYQPELTEAANELGVKIGSIVQSPTEGLIQFHNQQNKDN